MRKLLLLILLFPATVVLADDLLLNHHIAGLSSTLTRVMTCSGLQLNFAATESCCVDETCEDISSIELQRNENQNKCPGLVLDGQFYDINQDITIYPDVQSVDLLPNTLNNCLANGLSPAVGSGYIMTSGATSVGIVNMYLDVNDWNLHVTSIDGDVSCVGAVNYTADTIYFHSF